MKSKSAVVGMSGGVDSSVAAWLLKKEGYEVTGVMLNTWHENNSKFDEDIKSAQKVAETLDIDFHLIDAREVFKEKIVCKFIDEYTKARTPNPCVYCNYLIKWQILLDYANEHNIEKIATGHYADIVKLENGRFSIKNSASAKKDQTYVLYHLTQEQLQRAVFPLSGYEKDEVRKIAKEMGMDVANKPDSQEICFIPDDNYTRFLDERVNAEEYKGNFVTESGEILGKHKGIYHYTLGQRKGLGLSMGRPVFVKEINSDTNDVVISDEASIFSNEFYATDLNLMAVDEINEYMEVTAKLRYHHKGAKARIRIENGELHCILTEPQRAVTPGQAAVFYKDGYIVAGGIIK